MTTHPFTEKAVPKTLTLCGYSNCFRPFHKMRGFMPCCAFHYTHPKKWGDDGMTFTGSVWRKR